MLSPTSIAIITVAILAVAVTTKPLMVLSVLGVASFLCLSFIIASMTRHRQKAFPEARHMLEERVQKGQALHTSKYDLYLPTKNKGKQSGSNEAFLFLPGALVDHTAYAGLAIQLAERHSVLVAVVNLEPTRLAKAFNGVTTSRLVKMAKEIEIKANIGALEWNLGGHSLGSQTAKSMFPSLQMNYSWKRLVCLSGGMPPGVSRTLNRQNTLVVQASNDGFQKLYKNQDLSDYTVVKIKGGNHAGVAHYGPQLFPVKDGEREITLEKQQELTATAVANFLLNQE